MTGEFDSVLLEGGLKKLSEITGMHRDRIVRAHKKGQLPFIKKVGSQYVVFNDGLNKWLANSGERTKNFDDVMIEISRLVNESRKQRIEQKKESQNDDSK